MEEFYMALLIGYLIPISFFNLMCVIFMPHLFKCILTDENIFITIIFIVYEISGIIAALLLILLLLI